MPDTNDHADLSAATMSIWAKSHVDPLTRALDGWLPLHQHLDDSAEVAGLLWDRWAPPSVTHTLARVFGTEENARALVVWLAGTHDIGKASPAFAVQVRQLAEPMQHHGLDIDPRVEKDDRRRAARHEVVSFLAISEWLEKEHAIAPPLARSLASVSAAHHGNPAAASVVRSTSAARSFTGGPAWIAARAELLQRADAQWVTPSNVAAWSRATLTQPTLVLLSALVIVADWIASSDAFAPAPLGRQPSQSASHRAARAWGTLDFPRPWAAAASTQDASELLAARFDLPPGSLARPAQIDLVDLARTADEPGLMILEAEMGSGKTEAALLAAEIMAARFELSGIFVGLPTRATADGMFGRVLTWARLLGLETPSNLYLAHGSASLNADYSALPRESHFHSIGTQPASRDEHSATLGDEALIAHRWFASPRRGPLSNFVVGTIDQALFAGHRSRYLMLRHLALAGKVVIIDEAHAYDDFMSTYLTRVLEWLGAYGTPVIMLSATLPAVRRAEFHAAYLRGRRTRHPGTYTESPNTPPPASPTSRYPLITTADINGCLEERVPAASGRAKTIRVDRIEDDDASLLTLLEKGIADGGNVAIIRNTVRRAQGTASFLRAHCSDIPVTVAHSRYLAVDRARKDRRLLEMYSPSGARPRASIVVATQVIEQSLDIDFDLIVTDIAPVDLLLQRTGRLHRHHRPDRPEPLRDPRVVIAGVDWSQTPPRPEPGTLRVYDHAILIRTLAALEGRASLTIPDDIPPLVEAVYGADAPELPPGWAATYAEAERESQRARADQLRRAESFTLGHVSDTEHETPNLLGWLGGPDIDPELSPPGRGTVRDSSGETLEVIVLQRGATGELHTPSWLPEGGGVQIPDNEPPDRDLTRTILGCKLRLPLGMCGRNAIDRHITALERAFELPSWHSSHLLKGELVLVLDADGNGALNEFDVSYDEDEGLRYMRRAR